MHVNVRVNLYFLYFCPPRKRPPLNMYPAEGGRRGAGDEEGQGERPLPSQAAANTNVLCKHDRNRIDPGLDRYASNEISEGEWWGLDGS